MAVSAVNSKIIPMPCHARVPQHVGGLPEQLFPTAFSHSSVSFTIPYPFLTCMIHNIQMRALQLWIVANHMGVLRIFNTLDVQTSTLHYSMVTIKPGTAVVTVLRWLMELRYCSSPTVFVGSFRGVASKLPASRHGRQHWAFGFK